VRRAGAADVGIGASQQEPPARRPPEYPHVEREKAEKTERERLRNADPSELHPAERLADEPSGPARPSLWPQGLRGYLP